MNRVVGQLLRQCIRAQGPLFTPPLHPHLLHSAQLTDHLLHLSSASLQAVGATGSVLAIDVQERAVAATRELLERSLVGAAKPELQYECVCHSQLLEVRPVRLCPLMPHCSVMAAVFCLLPILANFLNETR